MRPFSLFWSLNIGNFRKNSEVFGSFRKVSADNFVTLQKLFFLFNLKFFIKMNKTSTIFGFCIAIVVLLCIVIYALRDNFGFGKDADSQPVVTD